MENNKDFGYELDWDSEIVKESEFELLPEGEYSFSVKQMEKGRFDGSEKMSACPIAVLTLTVTGADEKSGTITEKLYLNSKAEWRLSQFFTSIGQKKKGEPLRPKWNEVTGSVGRLTLSINEYTDKDGKIKKNNRVDSFLPHEPKTYTAGAF